MEKDKVKIKFPQAILEPIVSFLKGEEKKLKNTRKELKSEDPFIVGNRDMDNSVDADVAENVEHDRSFALRKQINRSIVAIRKTLTRIKLGKYGICQSCGRMIDTDRLAIKLTAEYCIDCERKKEAKSK